MEALKKVAEEEKAKTVKLEEEVAALKKAAEVGIKEMRLSPRRQRSCSRGSCGTSPHPWGSMRWWQGARNTDGRCGGMRAQTGSLQRPTWASGQSRRVRTLGAAAWAFCACVTKTPCPRTCRTWRGKRVRYFTITHAAPRERDGWRL